MTPPAGFAPVRVTWGVREPPLVPCAVGAVGEAARSLLHRLAERLGDRRGGMDGQGGSAPAMGLSGVFGRTGRGLVVVVLGQREHLPWSEGVTYLGRDPLAPGLLLPTLRAPRVPVEVYGAAVRTRVATDAIIACLDDGALLLPVAAARPLGLDAIRAALGAGT